MRYSDLIQFEPIESVIQLRDANRPDEAERLVSTFVISNDMAERIAHHMIPQISFDESVDHRGVLVVGNYGTGKSHLMSMISLVAENAEYQALIHHPEVAKASDAIAGKFKVHRIEISSLMSLREIITQQLEMFLEKNGVSYTFLPADKVTNNKVAFEEMMAAFDEVHPNHGVLLVVDEFLDYLRSRRDHDLVLDLSFLREIGEVSKNLRFRFVAGVQEAIFDSSRFQHVADSLRRVKDRFTQVLLARQDVSFVVSERLLKKSADQQNQIRSHLIPFAKFYGSMNERMDEYVRLFPVHPDYIGTFESLVFTEKRGALVTLRDQIQEILDDQVPENRPGLIGYDKFWETVRSNQVLRADPNIGPVLKVSEVLTERVSKAFTRPTYKPMALRIVDGLSVHRLTTGGDIYVPVGPTAGELRDSLCLFHPGIEEMGGEPEADLLSLVLTVLRETLKTVNGQFISKAPDSDQYYLDLKKDVDYDAQIEKRTETLSYSALDRAYFSAIRQLMERTDESTYVTGHQIWQYQVEWQDHKVERDGYLFFGAPNDRPTAQPARDFYIYFIQPFEPPRFNDNNTPDEVFFRLNGLDDEFRQLLSFYAAAQDLASTASGSARSIYFEKANDALREMSKWLQSKQMSGYEVTYQGKKKTMQDWTKGISIREKARLGPEERINFRDVVNIVSGLALSNHFAEIAPEYPTFSSLVTESNRKQLVGNALRTLAGGTRTKDAVIILDGLEILDGDRIDPTHSRYAGDVLKRLKSKGQGQVLNRRELVTGDSDVQYFAPIKYRLEPDLLITVLAALVYAGDIVLAISGAKIDSSKLNLLAEQTLDELAYFKHVETPKEINVSVLRTVFEMLALPPGLAQQATQGSDEPVKLLQEEVSKLTERVLHASMNLSSRLVFWGQPLLQEEEILDCSNSLSDMREFLESLALFNTVGKLKNLSIESSEITAQEENLKVLDMVERMLNLVSELGSISSYLSQAEMVLSPEHEWVIKAQNIREQVLSKLAKDRTAQHASEYRHQLTQLKKSYISAYTDYHGKVRLGTAEDKIKSELMKDPRLIKIRELAHISLLPIGQLTSLEEDLDNLESCVSLLNSDLEVNPICPHCNLLQANTQGDIVPTTSVLTQLDHRLDGIIENWVHTLLENLENPIIQSNMKLLTTDSRKIVSSFAQTGILPDSISQEFTEVVQEALAGLEKVTLTSEQIKHALLQGGSPATRQDLSKRFESLLSDQCRGKDAEKLRFVVE